MEDYTQQSHNTRARTILTKQRRETYRSSSVMAVPFGRKYSQLSGKCMERPCASNWLQAPKATFTKVWEDETLASSTMLHDLLLLKREDAGSKVEIEA